MARDSEDEVPHQPTVPGTVVAYARPQSQANLPETSDERLSPDRLTAYQLAAQPDAQRPITAEWLAIFPPLRCRTL
jgi:hypothetical protein